MALWYDAPHVALKRKKRGRGRPKKGTSPDSTEEVRQALVVAAIELVREKGMSAATSIALAKRVGISQSGFYQHFANVNECLGLAAVTFAEEMRRELRSIRDRFFALVSGPDDAILEEKLRRGFEHSLAYVLDQPRLVQLIMLFNRLQGDNSEFGIALNRVHEQVVDDMVAELLASARRVGLTEKDAPGIRIYVRFSLAIWYTAVEMSIADPQLDRALVIRMLTQSQQGILVATSPVPARKQRRA